jgi:VanZ family protein
MMDAPAPSFTGQFYSQLEVSNNQHPNRKMRWLATAAGIGMVVLVFYFSWVADPAMVAIKWLPVGVAKWADRHDTLRTGVALVPLGLLVGILLVVGGRLRRDWWRGWFAMAGVVVMAEVGQLFTPRRVFDLKDILWGIAGAAVGLAIARAGQWVYRFIAARHRRPPLPLPHDTGNIVE